MQKSNLQHQPDQQPSTKRTGKSAALVSPQGQRIVQLETMAENSQQAVERARIATMAAYAPAYTAQRKLAGMIAESPRQTAQLQGFAHAFGVIQTKTDVKENKEDATSDKTSNKKINTPTQGEKWFRFKKDGDIINSFATNITDQTPKGASPVSTTVDVAAKAKEDGVESSDIASKTRATHFKWGDAAIGIKKGDRTGKWTWHHKVDQYQMELVDMHAHGGFFHYGGFSQWDLDDEDI